MFLYGIRILCGRIISPALAVKGPAGAILPAKQLVALSTVSNSPTGAIIFDFLADAIGHQTQEHRLNQVAAVLEIA